MSERLKNSVESENEGDLVLEGEEVGKKQVGSSLFLLSVGLGSVM